MSWNPKTELAKRAGDIAREKHPKGFNKAQLIECSKEVFGGFGVTQVGGLAHRSIKTKEDVNNMGNAMAFIDGGYPAGMSTCFIVGINGGCGLDCPAYLDCECENGDAMGEGLTGEDLAQHIELYGEAK